jgi:cell wall-associated NlpC family hydrolase
VSDALSQLDAAHTVAAADHRLAVETERARAKYARVARTTAQLERRRAAAVVQLAAERDRIGGMLAERKRLLASVQGEVEKLKQEEARRQALLAAQARARLARQQAELRAQAAARAQAAQAAAERKRRAAETPDPTPAPASTTTTAEVTPAAPPATTTEPQASATTTAPATTPTPAPVGGGHPEAAPIAMRYLGVPYVWGGASPSGFDCSGLVMYVFAQLGIVLPHYAAAQYGYGTPVPRDQLQPGDLVFFDGLDHVGIYIGGGQIVHAPHTGDVVKISPISEFGAGYVGARRI